MNTVAWAIIIINVNFGSITYNDHVRWTTKESCEEALAALSSYTSRSVLKYKCMQVVVPAPAVVVK